MRRLFLWLLVASAITMWPSMIATRSLAQGGDAGGGGNAQAGMRFISVQGRNFAMQETEVTRGQWKAVVGKYPEEFIDAWNYCFDHKKTVFEDSHPVTCVALGMAQAFAKLMNKKNDGFIYRLPTEEEWEYAAGNIDGPTFGWCGTTSTHPVGRLKPNDGLYDMAGNAWEMTFESAGVFERRGGGWFTDPSKCSSANRGNLLTIDIDAYTGFRLVRHKAF